MFLLWFYLSPAQHGTARLCLRHRRVRQCLSSTAAVVGEFTSSLNRDVPLLYTDWWNHGGDHSYWHAFYLAPLWEGSFSDLQSRGVSLHTWAGKASSEGGELGSKGGCHLQPEGAGGDEALEKSGELEAPKQSSGTEKVYERVGQEGRVSFCNCV